MKAIETFKKENNTETLTKEQRSSIDKAAVKQAIKNLRPKTDYKTSFVKMFVSTKQNEVHVECKFAKDSDQKDTSDESDVIKVDVLKECKKFLKLVGVEDITAGLEYELSIATQLTGIVRNTGEVGKLDIDSLIVGKQAEMMNADDEKVKFTNHILNDRPDEVNSQIEASKEVSLLEFILEKIDVGFVVSDGLHVKSIRNIAKKDALATPDENEDSSNDNDQGNGAKEKGLTASELVAEFLESLDINDDIIKTCRALVNM